MPHHEAFEKAEPLIAKALSLDEGFAESRVSFLFVRDEPWFDPSRANPRFVSLLGKLDLPKRS
jgi:hypothetical protein